MAYRKVSTQKCKIKQEPRKNGPDVWVARWREYALDGAVKYKKHIIGTLKQYPTKTAAEQAFSEMRQQVNSTRVMITIGDLARRFKAEYMPARHRGHTCSTDNSNMAHVLGKWGQTTIDEIVLKPMLVTLWLNGDLRARRKPFGPLARNTRANIRVLMKEMFTFAREMGIITLSNPIEVVTVRNGARQVDRLFKITPAMFGWMQNDAKTPYYIRVMEFLAMALGLRGSEMLGLRWEHIDLDLGQMQILKSCVRSFCDQDTKTEASETKIPIKLHPLVTDTLRHYQEWALEVNGFVFGNDQTERPFYLSTLQEKHHLPALRRMGEAFGIEIPKGTGWHAYRHTFRAAVNKAGYSLEVQRDAMRHADIKMPLRYGRMSDEVLAEVAAARGKVIEMYHANDVPLRTGTGGD